MKRRHKVGWCIFGGVILLSIMGASVKEWGRIARLYNYGYSAADLQAQIVRSLWNSFANGINFLSTEEGMLILLGVGVLCWLICGTGGLLDRRSPPAPQPKPSIIPVNVPACNRPIGEQNDNISKPCEFKICPFCKEQIRGEAVKCRFCGEWLEDYSEPKPEPNREHEKCPEPARIETSQEPAKTSAALAATESEQESSTPDRPSPEVERTVSPAHARQIRGSPLLPLLLFAFWIFWYVVPLAIENGASGTYWIVLGILSYCTSPVSILVLVTLGIWFWTARRNSPLAGAFCEILRLSVRQALAIIILCLPLIAFSYSSIQSALEVRNAAQRQKLSAMGVNPDAFKGWEVAQGADQSAVDARLGFPVATKKRMRETFALSLMGAVASVPNVSVELQGPEHDKLIVSSPGMSATIASNLPVLLRTADADFWNRTRFLGFNEFVFSGSNYSQSIPVAEFAQWGVGYDSFVSNMVAMYESGFSKEQTSGGENNTLNPALQKVMRENFASVFKGAFNAVYKGLDVRLEGENDDRLIFYIKEMDAATANELLKALKDNKGRNCGNALRAMAFRELAFSGDNYNMSFNKANFVEWSYKYEDYLSSLEEVAKRMSGAFKGEAAPP